MMTGAATTQPTSTGLTAFGLMETSRPWTQTGGMIIHGRSDATLNSFGVRIGTAEIYRVVEQLSEVAESIAIGQEYDNDTRVVLFIKLAEGSRNWMTSWRNESEPICGQSARPAMFPR